MWKYSVQLEGQLKTVGRMMRISRHIPKTANTHSEHVIVIPFPLQQWLRKRTSVLHYTYEGWNFNSGNYLFTTDTK